MNGMESLVHGQVYSTKAFGSLASIPCFRHDDIGFELDTYTCLPLCSFAHACEGCSLQAGTPEIAIATYARPCGIGRRNEMPWRRLIPRVGMLTTTGPLGTAQAGLPTDALYVVGIWRVWTRTGRASAAEPDSSDRIQHLEERLTALERLVQRLAQQQATVGTSQASPSILIPEGATNHLPNPVPPAAADADAVRAAGAIPVDTATANPTVVTTGGSSLPTGNPISSLFRPSGVSGDHSPMSTAFLSVGAALCSPEFQVTTPRIPVSISARHVFDKMTILVLALSSNPGVENQVSLEHGDREEILYAVLTLLE
uniref:Uncharacterized protein n=1 Tax=Ananas comosus var. bracteatus TaxID=296719 RepID=A0A6V7P5A8_ANACO|nr:unnamed protein product [Ananas comosus var. bracteatus]